MSEKSHRVHTLLYSDFAEKILKALFYNAEHGHYVPYRTSRKLAFGVLKKAEDGELVIDVDTDHRYFYSFNRSIWSKKKLQDDLIRKELAWLIKQMTQNFVVATCGSGTGKSYWDRKENYDCIKILQMNPEIHAKLTAEDKLPVKEIYCMYELLNARKNIEAKYGKAVVDKIRGEQYDPVRTELEKARSEQMQLFAAEKKQKEDEAYSSWQKKLDEVKTKLRSEYESVCKSITDDYATKVEELERSITEALKMSA